MLRGSARISGVNTDPMTPSSQDQRLNGSKCHVSYLHAEPPLSLLVIRAHVIATLVTTPREDHAHSQGRW